MAKSKTTPVKMKLKRNDKVIVIAGRDKDKEGKILLVDRKNNKLIVEGVNMVTKHMKPNSSNQQGGIVKKEAPIHASNVMYLHKGQPTRIGYRLDVIDREGKQTTVKVRIAKTTGEEIDK